MRSKQVVIDAREPHEYSSSHVEGAINIPLSNLSTESPGLKDINKNAKVIVYCRSGGRSNLAIQLLKDMGFSNLVNGINEENYIKKYV
jgi:rhodanese-related sulfurtransferase